MLVRQTFDGPHVRHNGALAGCSKRPSSKAAASEEARRTLRYVESLSDARTLLADFFSILLHTRLPITQRQVELNQAIRPHSMLAQHRIAEDGMVLQRDSQCRHIFDGNSQPCDVYDRAPGIQTYTLNRHMLRNCRFKSGQKLCPGKMPFCEQLIR